MTTETNPGIRKLKPPEQLEKSTLDVFAGMFKRFHYECGYNALPPQDKIDAFWFKLRDFPEKIIIDMFSIFLDNKVRRCPAVEEMVDVCRNEWSSYKQQYARQVECEKEVEQEASPVNEAWRHEYLRTTADCLRRGITGQALWDKLEFICKKYGVAYKRPEAV